MICNGVLMLLRLAFEQLPCWLLTRIREHFTGCFVKLIVNLERVPESAMIFLL